jgi:hypothetical protein
MDVGCLSKEYTLSLKYLRIMSIIVKMLMICTKVYPTKHPTKVVEASPPCLVKQNLNLHIRISPNDLRSAANPF